MCTEASLATHASFLFFFAFLYSQAYLHVSLLLAQVMQFHCFTIIFQCTVCDNKLLES